MPTPTAYTETQLAAFMLAELADVGVVLGWTADGAAFPGTTTRGIVEAIYDVENVLGVSDVASVLSADVPMLRAYARVAVWRAAAKATASRFDVSDIGQSLKLSQLHQQSRAELASAETQAAAFGEDETLIIGIGAMNRSANPYLPVPLTGIGELG